jgi:hypothetical protein
VLRPLGPPTSDVSQEEKKLLKVTADRTDLRRRTRLAPAGSGNRLQPVIFSQDMKRISSAGPTFKKRGHTASMSIPVNRFILSARPNGSGGTALKERLSEIKRQIIRLIPGAEVKPLEHLSALLLSCHCRDVAEVKSKLASCSGVNKVIADSSIRPMPWVLEKPPSKIGK